MAELSMFMGESKMYNHKIVNTETGEEIIQPLSESEAAQIDANFEETKKELAASKAQAKAKATQKAALLDRLGITEDEAKLLLS
jgi:hypothetical protein